ncbi:ABC transporter B family member 19 [Amborella trichopoda]|nr:ABC transporter B family member 19 [Amborella trichopoda]|eukprot:XP_006846532.2 ABC transporter B family member 19 [Amborella trichopoda]
MATKDQDEESEKEKQIAYTKNQEEEEEKKEKSKSHERTSLPFYKLLSYADMGDVMLMAMGTVGAIVHGMAQPVGYLLLGKALSAFGNIHDTSAMVTAIYEIVRYVWYMALATFPAGILEIGCWMYASERQTSRLRLSFFRAVLRQEIGAFDTDLTPGNIMAGITSHMSLIQDAIGEKLGHFLSCFAAFFGGILIAFYCCWQVAMFTLLVVPMIMLVGATYSKKMNSFSKLRMDFLSEATAMVEQNVSQIKTVFAFVGESSALRTFSQCVDKQFKLSKQEALIKGIGMGMFQGVTFIMWALIIWIGAVVVSAGKSDGGLTLAAVISILFGAISLTHAAPDMQAFNQAGAAGYEVFRVIERKPQISYTVAGITPEKIKGDIELHDVHFAYPSRQAQFVLRGFSLSIPAGNVVALVGSSGCGKSTIISLIERFYDPSQGEVLIDGQNIKELDLKFLRRNIGLVSQEPSLFTGTIRDNLRLGNPDASDDDIKNAATIANADSFISKLPDQYNTEVGDRGAQLSGGQKQRIAIARAILKNPPILLLDEATSALDSESEKLVQDALERAMSGRTVIVIAHRLSTIINANTIAVVEDGQVRQTGTHHELLQTNDFYHALFTTQSIDNIKSDNDSSQREENLSMLVGPNATGTMNATGTITEIWSPLYEDHHSTKSQITELSMDVKSQSSELPTVSRTKGKMQRPSPFFRIWFGLRKHDLGKTLLGSAAAALSGISKPLFGFYIMTIGVAYYSHDPKGQVRIYSISFAVVGLLAVFTHSLQHYFYGVVGEAAMGNFRQALYSAVLRNELAWFEKPENNASLLTSHIVADTCQIKVIISDRTSVIVQCISSIAIATTVSMVVNWRMGLVAWAVMPCHFIGGLVQARSAQGFALDSSLSHSKLSKIMAESASNIRTVASFVCEDRLIAQANSSLMDPLMRSRIESLKYGFIQGFSLCLWNIAHAVALWYTTVLVERKQASFENGIRSYQIFSLTVPSITELWTLLPTVFASLRILRPALRVLDRQSHIDPQRNGGLRRDRICGAVCFQDVQFSYPLRPDSLILQGLSFSIGEGMQMALVGPSGSGKSSVLGLVLRFYDPQKGRILIDGRDIRDYELRWLRTHIGLVQQEPLLFSTSIVDNIRYGNENASESEILEASKQANAHGFVSSLPDGYDTMVGEKGCQLSGGQKQRIAIARALLKRPSIMMLDEATSALDAESEAMVMRAIAQSGEGCGCTQIRVAHRLSTVMDSDTIVVMDKGKVVEMGHHSELVTSEGGVYSRFFKLQNLSGKSNTTLD